MPNRVVVPSTTAAATFDPFLSSYEHPTTTMATDQIRQMVNFILQEAHEKANEIRVKVRSFYVV